MRPHQHSEFKVKVSILNQNGAHSDEILEAIYRAGLKEPTGYVQVSRDSHSGRPLLLRPEKASRGNLQKWWKSLRQAQALPSTIVIVVIRETMAKP